MDKPLPPTPIKDALQSSAPVGAIQVQGWVRTRRDSKDFSFIELNDGSSLRNLQIIAKKDALPNYADIQRLNTGASIVVEGALMPSQGKGQKWELVARNIEIVGGADESYPLQKKGHTPEFCARSRICVHGRIFSVACSVCAAGSRSPFTSFFRLGVSFTFTHRSSPEAIAKARASYSEFQPSTSKIRRGKTARSITRRISFARQTYLTVSGQLEAEAFACALTKVYTFGPTFRAENSNTSRHASEFWMIEPEMAFCDLSGNMDLAEELVKYLIGDARKQCAEELEMFREIRGQGVACSTRFRH
jgi:asparaginyl-tRNA synthetase